MTALIQTQNLSFHYPGQDSHSGSVLMDISLQVQEGEFVALIGSNGSGKTTLIRHFNGLLLPTSGRVLVDGLDTTQPENLPLIRQYIGMVFQHPEDQIVSSIVEEDVAFGPLNYGVPLAEIHERVEEALHEVNMWQYRHRPAYMLSAGQMQRVALAGALATRPRCILFDESTAMLDPAGRHTVLQIMSRLNHQGATILFITHYMEEACQAKRVIAMHHGEIILDGSPQEVFSHANTLSKIGLQAPAAATLASTIRRHLPSLPQNILTMENLREHLPQYSDIIKEEDTSSPRKSHEYPANSYINVSDLSHIYLKDTPLAQLALDGINLCAQKGMGHGLIGATGSGKSTLLQHLNGLLLPQSGQVHVGRFDLNHPDVDVIALRRNTGLVFQQPDNQLFEQYVGDEIAYGLRLSPEHVNLKERVRWAMELVGLDFEIFKDRFTFSLSGGERRKVALASTLVLQPENLLLDEPSAGLDPASRNELLQQLKHLQQNGTTLVISSHQMEDIAELAENLTVCHNGQDGMSGPVEEIFQQTETLHNYDLEPPAATRVAYMLREKGWNIYGEIINSQQLDAALKAFTQS